MSDHEKVQFFNIGTQYYIAGRFAAFAGFIPVAANLFHHSVEMYIKGHLSSGLNEPDRRKLGHKLPEIWERFKQEVRDPQLKKFDDVVAELHKFESIRYPEEIVAKGMLSSISLSRNAVLYNVNAPTRPEPKYYLAVEDIDELVNVIFTTSSVNPSFFMNGLNADASDFLGRSNKFQSKKPDAQTEPNQKS